MLCVIRNLFVLFIVLQLCLRVAEADCEVYGLALKKGEVKTTPGKCSQIVCNGPSYDDYTIQACPNAYAPKHCTFVPADLKKPYPDCCPHWNC